MCLIEFMSLLQLLIRFLSVHNTVATLMDLSEDFDCVNHEILFTKLEHHGVNSYHFKLDKKFIFSTDNT